MMLRNRGPVVASVVTLGLALSLGGPAQADPEDDTGGSLTSDGTYRIADAVDQAIAGLDGGDGDGGGGGGGSGESCWFHISDSPGTGIPGEFTSHDVMEAVFGQADTDVPDGAPFINRCRSVDTPTSGTSWMYHADGIAHLYDPSYYVFWDGGEVEAGTPLDVPLLEEVWVELEGQLGGPEPVVTPPLGEPVVVDHYSFVAVDNPQDEVSGENCMPAAGLCVTMRAEPTLRFDPGDGSDVIECDPAGTRFDPEDDRSPAEQAAGGCAHAYSERSAAGFPGRVEVVWEVEWTSTGHGGISGVFDPLVLPDGDGPNALRVVDEAQAVVDAIDNGGGE